tara:strand:+ start:40414 stop:41190 length:777 start_codon:yes stop_codon:yes gene_type:complete
VVDDAPQSDRSLEDLDKRIESDRRIAVTAFETSFSGQVVAAISAIGEINQVANARIQTDTRVAAARIASHAEVTCIELLSTVELTALKIDHLKSENSSETNGAHEKITAKIINEARLEIEDSCNNSVEEIRRHGDMAVAQISENVNTAIATIQKHVADVKSEIENNEKIAVKKLEASKVKKRTLESAADDGEEAKLKITSFSKEVTNKLTKMSAAAILDINRLSSAVLEEISAVVTTAETKVLKMKEVALSRLRNLKA